MERTNTQGNTHTATPWRIGDAGTTVFGPRTERPSPEIVAPHLKRANAAYMVHCVNTHEALVSALEALATLTDEANATQHAGQRVTAEMWSNLYDATRKANSALALAEAHA